MTPNEFPLLSFHASSALKEQVLQRTKEYLAQYVAGQATGKELKKSHDGMHHLQNDKRRYKGLPYKFYEIDYGIPQELAYVQEYVFQGHEQDVNHVRNPLQFWEAVPVGASLGGIFGELAMWMLTNPKHGIQQLVPPDSKVSYMINHVYQIYLTARVESRGQVSVATRQQAWLDSSAMAMDYQATEQNDLYGRSEADAMQMVSYLAEGIGRGGDWAERASGDAVEAWVRAWYNHQQLKESLGLAAPDSEFIGRKMEVLAIKILAWVKGEHPWWNSEEAAKAAMSIRQSAFYGDGKLKEQVKQRVRNHIARAIQRQETGAWTYQQDIDIAHFLCQKNPPHRGLHYDFYERNYGIPEVLAHVEEEVFSPYVSLANVESVLQFWEAIPVGADLTNVFSQLGAWMLQDPVHGMQQFLEPGSEIAKLSLEVAELCQKQSTEVEMWRDKWKHLEKLVSTKAFFENSDLQVMVREKAAWVAYHIAAVQGRGDEWGPKEGGSAAASWRSVGRYLHLQRIYKKGEQENENVLRLKRQMLASTYLNLLRTAPVSTIPGLEDKQTRG